MKAVFVDFDGVLHPSVEILDLELDTLALQGAPALLEKGLFRWAEHLECVLDQAEDSHEIAVVVHSSWRMKSWASSSLVRELLGPLGHRFEGFVQRELPRELAIRDFVSRVGLSDYIILDDAVAEFSADRARLVVTNPLLGVTDSAVLARLGEWAGVGAHEAKLCVPVP